MRSQRKNSQSLILYGAPVRKRVHACRTKRRTNEYALSKSWACRRTACNAWWRCSWRQNISSHRASCKEWTNRETHRKPSEHIAIIFMARVYHSGVWSETSKDWQSFFSCRHSLSLDKWILLWWTDPSKKNTLEYNVLENVSRIGSIVHSEFSGGYCLNYDE